MDDNFVPEDDSMGVYKMVFNEFKQTCEECDKIEEEDRIEEGDGYNVDDFENV